MKIKYLEGMKYVLSEDFEIDTPVCTYWITDDWFELQPDGHLKIKAGFAWDGASGPTLDSKTCMRASVVHDVFCICMRDRRIDYNTWQDVVNKFFYTMCVADGMWPWRAKLWHMGVEVGDAGNPKQGPDRIVKEAP